MSGLVIVAHGASQGQIVHIIRSAERFRKDVISDIERQSLAEVRDNTHIGGPLDALPFLDAPALASSAPSASGHNLTVFWFTAPLLIHQHFGIVESDPLHLIKQSFESCLFL
jgi:hypothetical protein